MPEQAQVLRALRLAPIIGWLICLALPLMLYEFSAYGMVWAGSLGAPLYAVGLAATLISLWRAAPTARVLAWVFLATLLVDVAAALVALAYRRSSDGVMPETFVVTSGLNLALVIAYAALVARALWVRAVPPDLIDLAPPNPDDLPINRPSAPARPATGGVWRRASDAAEGAPPERAGTLADQSDPWRRGAPGVSQQNENRP